MNWSAEFVIAIARIHHRIDWRCQVAEQEGRNAAVTLRRSLGQKFRYLREDLAGNRREE